METKVLNNQGEFMVRFPDGTVITGNPRFEVYKNTILKIGIDRVASFAKGSKLKRYGQPYINKTPNKILNDGGYKQEFISGYYVVSDFSALNMSRFLRDLSKDLDLGLTIYNPCKTPLAN